MLAFSIDFQGDFSDRLLVFSETLGVDATVAVGGQSAGVTTHATSNRNLICFLGPDAAEGNFVISARQHSHHVIPRDFS